MEYLTAKTKKAFEKRLLQITREMTAEELLSKTDAQMRAYASLMDWSAQFEQYFKGKTRETYNERLY